MKIFTYNKLVRDKYTEIIKDLGHSATFRTLTEEEYIAELNKKLFEEVNEFLEAHNPEEMADILEVLYSIAKYKNIDLDEVEKIRLNKRSKKGGFDNRSFLIDVTEQ